jgi:fused signal recognition particle receptor
LIKPFKKIKLFCIFYSENKKIYFSWRIILGFFDRLKEGLTKTRESFIEKVESIFTGRKIDEVTLDELEEALIISDVGTKAASEIMNVLKEKVKMGSAKDVDSVKQLLKEEMITVLENSHTIVIQGKKPFVILSVGVNGVGKTTTIGKLASKFHSQGLSVLLAAGDTFRAAGIEQLEIWAKRANAQIVKHQMGSDPAAVAFDAIVAAKSRNVDILIIDTAGRLHTKSNLMEELKKIRRTIQKAMPEAPQEILLVVDATTGQNALRQARLFNETIGITGIALTKLDGTAKGGIVFAIKKELGIPVKLIGVGEKIEDLRDFDPKEFVEALFS